MPYGKGAIEAITGRDQYGRKQNAIEQARDLATGAAPLPFQGVISKKGGETSPLNTVLSSAGVATSKYRTPAERLARQMMFDRMPANPGPQTTKQKLMRDLEDGIRQGKFPTQEIGKHLNNGELGVDDAVKILESSQTPELVRNFKRLSIEDVLKVWNKANDQERKQLRPLLKQKAERFAVDQDSDSPKYTADEWKAIAARIQQALAAKPKAAKSGWTGIPFLPTGASTSVVPSQPPAH